MVDIDFDDASREWRKNKISLTCGEFRYCCIEPTKKGEKCKNKIIQNNLCHVHLKKPQQKNKKKVN